MKIDIGIEQAKKLFEEHISKLMPGKWDVEFKTTFGDVTEVIFKKKIIGYSSVSYGEQMDSLIEELK